MNFVMKYYIITERKDEKSTTSGFKKFLYPIKSFCRKYPTICLIWKENRFDMDVKVCIKVCNISNLLQETSLWYRFLLLLLLLYTCIGYSLFHMDLKKYAFALPSLPDKTQLARGNIFAIWELQTLKVVRCSKFDCSSTC